MAYDVLVLDIDGTLTNSNKEISPATKQAIYEVQQRGHNVILASGRPTCGVLPFAKELKLTEQGGYILSFNGARIINAKSREVIYQKTLPKEVIPMVYKAALEEGVGIISYDEDCIIAGTEIDEYMEKESKINHIPIKKVEDFVSYFTFDINKCLMTAAEEKLAQVEIRMRERFGEQLSIYRSEPYFLEIMPKDVDKAHSLGILLDHLGLSRDQMISCGDGYNDLTMLEYAGWGVAMANANEQVKKAADYVTKSNDDDGVAHAINKFIL